MSIRKGSPGKTGPEAVRTTISLDRDVKQRALQFSAARGISFRKGLNELVRLGWIAQQQPQAKEFFLIKPRNMGLKLGLSYDNIEELIEFGEGPQHR